MDKKKTIQLTTIFAILIAVVGGTLAYWQWTTDEEQNTNVTFTVTQDFSCSADGGGNISHSDIKLAPTDCTDTSRAIKRKVTVSPVLDRDNLTVSLDLWLNVHELGEGLKKSNNFKYVLTTSSNSCAEGTIISEGNFKGRKPGDKIRLITNDLHTVTPTPEEYYLYIWLDKEETNSNTMNQRFNFSLGGVCDEVETLVGDAYAIVTGEPHYATVTFLRTNTAPQVGSIHNGEEIVGVYSDIETTNYRDYRDVHWSNYYPIKIIFEGTIRPISIASWFSTGDGVVFNGLSKLDTSQVTNMSGLFSYTGDLEGIENWDVSNVRDMSHMFSYATISNDISNWDVSNVRDMSYMFGDYYTNLQSDISSWDVSNVRDMSYMFRDQTSSLDLSNWNVANVTNMESMFGWTSELESVGDISNWDTSSVTNMSQMFVNTSSMNPLNLSGWDVSNVISSDNFSDNSNITPPNFK